MLNQNKTGNSFLTYSKFQVQLFQLVIEIYINIQIEHNVYKSLFTRNLHNYKLSFVMLL